MCMNRGCGMKNIRRGSAIRYGFRFADNKLNRRPWERHARSHSDESSNHDPYFVSASSEFQQNEGTSYEHLCVAIGERELHAIFLKHKARHHSGSRLGF